MQTITKSPKEIKDSTLNNVDWLSSWYRKECNGDWEHTYGISIQTLDNPGWSVRIDLLDTSFENLKCFLIQKKFLNPIGMQ